MDGFILYKRYFKSIRYFPIKIIIKVKNRKRIFAFLEFYSYEIVLKILNKYNGGIYKKIIIKLNRMRNYGF